MRGSMPLNTTAFALDLVDRTLLGCDRSACNPFRRGLEAMRMMHHLIPLIQRGGVVASGIGLFIVGLRCGDARERSNAWRAAHARGRRGRVRRTRVVTRREHATTGAERMGYSTQLSVGEG